MHGIGNVKNTLNDSTRCCWNKVRIVRRVPTLACGFWIRLSFVYKWLIKFSTFESQYSLNLAFKVPDFLKVKVPGLLVHQLAISHSDSKLYTRHLSNAIEHQVGRRLVCQWIWSVVHQQVLVCTIPLIKEKVLKSIVSKVRRKQELQL